MKTCCICGMGFKSPTEDIVVYGCPNCAEGDYGTRNQNHIIWPSKPVEEQSPYSTRILRRNIVKVEKS